MRIRPTLFHKNCKCHHSSHFHKSVVLFLLILRSPMTMSSKKTSATCLPMTRVAKIMQSASGVGTINQDVVMLTAKATEIFIADLARRAYESTDGEMRTNRLEYENICDLVHKDSRYEFLRDTTPRKIKFSEALALIEQHARQREGAQE